MSIKTRVLVWVEPTGQGVELGEFDFAAPPAVGDTLALPSQPVLQVNWKQFAPHLAEADGVQLLLGCSYRLTPSTESPLDAVEEQQTRINNKLRENQKIITEVQGRAFKDATAYANVIVIAGYAAIFTIWSNVRSILTPLEISCIAGLLLFSVTIFVVFELSKMIIMSLIMRRNSAAAMRDPMMDGYLDTLIDAEQIGIRSMGTFMKAWPLFLVATIAPAFAAAAYLFWKFYTVISATAP